MVEYRVLGIAAATGKIGYVLLEDERLVDWGLSKAASKSADAAATKISFWIDLLKPEAVVYERLGKQSHKQGRTLELIAAIAKVAEEAPVVDAAVPRLRTHQNKYEEAENLANRFPDLKSRLPKKPPLWLPEPVNMIIFEALTLALQIEQTD